ncbi:MAG: hypothetical protein ACLFVP_02685 [Candidatus Bathyarchaeia archaeon]
MFSGVRRSYVLLILYVMEVIERVGTEPALEILQYSAEKQGEIIAKEIRDEIEEGLSPLELGEKVYIKFMSETGAEIEVHKRDEVSVTFIVNRCPFYEALLDVGVDCGLFLEGLCGNLTLPSIECTLKQFDPRLTIDRIISKESAEDICVERVHLKEG